MAGDGLRYFSLDCDFTEDPKFQKILRMFGTKGFFVVIMLWVYIYTRGYYCDWDNSAADRFMATLRYEGVSVGVGAVREIISAAIREGLFSADLYQQYGILTSKGIQTRFFKAKNGYRDKVAVDERYLLINAPKNVVFVSNQRENKGFPASGSKRKGKESRYNNIYTTARAETLENAEAIWTDAKRRLALRMRTGSYETWIRPLELADASMNNITLGAPPGLGVKTLEALFSVEIINALTDVGHPEFTVSFIELGGDDKAQTAWASCRDARVNTIAQLYKKLNGEYPSELYLSKLADGTADYTHGLVTRAMMKAQSYGGKTAEYILKVLETWKNAGYVSADQVPSC